MKVNRDGAYDLDADRLAKIWEPKCVPPTDIWVTENVWFSPKAWASAGFWNYDLFPYTRGVLQAFDDPEVREIILMWATQTGKTSLLGAMVAKSAVFALFASQIACPDANSALEHQQTKLIPVLQGVEALAHRIKPESKRSRRVVDLGDSLIYYSWSARWTVSGRAAAFIAITEANLHSRRKNTEADPVEMVRDRCKGFQGQHKILVEGKPATKGACRMDSNYQSSDQRKYHVPCPHCKAHQVLVLGDRDADFGLKWTSNRHGDPDRDSVHYLCSANRCRIDQGHKANMIRAGVWVPKGCIVGPDGRLDGIPERSPERSGFQLDSLYANSVSWHSYATEFVRAKRGGVEALKNFIQGWKAEAFDDEPATRSDEEILSHEGDYDAGTIPEAPLALHIVVDAQEKRLFYNVWGWGYGAECWLVRYGEVESLEGLDEIVGQSVWGPGGEQYKISAGYIDSGDGNRTPEIYQFCATRFPFWVPLKGTEQYKQLSIISHSKLADYQQIGMELLKIDPGQALDQMNLKFAIKKGDPGYVWFHRNIGGDYIRAMKAWQKKKLKPDRYGIAKSVWVSTSSTYEHHGDCCKYAQAIGFAYGFVHQKRPPELTEADKQKAAEAQRKKMEARQNYTVTRRDGRGWWDRRS